MTKSRLATICRQGPEGPLASKMLPFLYFCYKKGGILDAMGLKGHIEFVCRMRTIGERTHFCVERKCPFFLQKRLEYIYFSKYFNLFCRGKKDRQRAKLFVCQRAKLFDLLRRRRERK